jgi:hypothetical protein
MLTYADVCYIQGKGLVVIRLTQQRSENENENENEKKSQQAVQSASAPRTKQMWTIFAMPHGHNAEEAPQMAALSLQPPPPPRKASHITSYIRSVA